MKVTVCELDPRDGYLEDALRRLAGHVESVGSDFLLLPEMCFGPWLAASEHSDSVSWQSSVNAHAAQIDRLPELHARAVVGTRPIVNAQGSRRNEAYVWAADTGRAVGFHDKYYLPNEPGFWEHEWYDRGPREFDVARALGMRIGVQICTEMWFLEWARHYAACKADLVCVPRCTPHASTDKWLAGGRTLAVCAGAYCLSSNLWYPEGSAVDSGGLGWIVDPEGNVLATTDAATPFATVEIDLALARKRKQTYPRYVPE